MPEFIHAHHLVPMVALTPLLLAVALSDLRHLRIPNGYALAAAAVFAFAVLMGLVPDLAMRVLVAASVLLLGFAAYCLRLFGAGDVKFLAVLLLFVPIPSLHVYAFVFSGALALGIAAFVALKRVPAIASLNWRSMAPGRQLPMGVPIALSGLLHPLALAYLAAID